MARSSANSCSLRRRRRPTRTDAIPMRASKASTPAAIGKMLRIANVGLAGVAGAGFAFSGTTGGVAACWGGGGAGLAAGFAAAEVAGTAVRFTVRVTVRVVTGVGLEAVRVVRVVRFTVRVAVRAVACVVSDAGAV